MLSKDKDKNLGDEPCFYKKALIHHSFWKKSQSTSFI